jgi:hypothetical protein
MDAQSFDLDLFACHDGMEIGRTTPMFMGVIFQGT